MYARKKKGKISFRAFNRFCTPSPTFIVVSPSSNDFQLFTDPLFHGCPGHCFGLNGRARSRNDLQGSVEPRQAFLTESTSLYFSRDYFYPARGARYEAPLITNFFFLRNVSVITCRGKIYIEFDINSCATRVENPRRTLALPLTPKQSEPIAKFSTIYTLIRRSSSDFCTPDCSAKKPRSKWTASSKPTPSY